MKKIQLAKTINLPENRMERLDEPTLDKEERSLRILILNNFTPIYIGDRVRVSERWAGDGKNPDEGKVGEVTGIECGMQGAVNIEYLVYQIRPYDGKGFQTYHYTLDRNYQPLGNQLLEKLLRETNAEFEAQFK